MLTYIYNKFIYNRLNKKIPKGHFITQKILDSIICGIIDSIITIILILSIISAII